jgi:hypothetical protein
VDALPETHQVVVDLIVAAVEFLEDDDALVALLLGVRDDLLQVDVGGFIILEEMLFGVFDDAVGTERHEAVSVAAEVGEEL